MSPRVRPAPSIRRPTSRRRALLAAALGLVLAAATARALPSTHAHVAVRGAAAADCLGPSLAWDAALARCFPVGASGSVAPGDYVRWVIDVSSGAGALGLAPVQVAERLAPGLAPVAGSLVVPGAPGSGWSALALPAPGSATAVAAWAPPILPTSGRMAFNYGANELWAAPVVSGAGTLDVVLLVSDPAAQRCAPSPGGDVAWLTLLLPSPPAGDGGTVAFFTATTTDPASVVGEAQLTGVPSQPIPPTSPTVPVAVALPPYPVAPSFKMALSLGGMASSGAGTPVLAAVSFGTAAGAPQVCFDAAVPSACPLGTTSGSSGTAPAVPLGVATLTGTANDADYRTVGAFGGELGCIPPAAPQLAISKSGPAVLPAGGTVTFSVTLGNGGTAPTSGAVTLKDLLPAGLTFKAQAAGAPAMTCAAAGQLVTCAGAPDLAVGASLTISYQATVDVAATGTLANAAWITAGGGDPRPLPAGCTIAPPLPGGTAQSSDALCTRASGQVVNGTLTTVLQLRTVDGGAVPGGYQVAPGARLGFRVTTQETGGVAAATATVTAQVPAHARYQAGTSEGWSGSCDAAGTTCTRTFPVAASGQVLADFTVVVDSPIPDGTFTIEQRIGALPGTCPACSDVLPTVPKLTISKVGGATMPLGGAASYAVTVHNAGGSATSGPVAFKDVLPSGLAWSGQTGSVGPLACAPAGQEVACSGAPNLASGADAVVTYSATVTAAASGLLTNAAWLTAGGGDVRPFPSACAIAAPAAGVTAQSADRLCTRTSATVAVGAVDVTLTLAQVNGAPPATGYQVRPGDLLAFQAAIRETSGSAGAVTTLTATVPATTSYAGTGEGWGSGCGAAASTCTQDVLVGAGASTTRSFTVRVDAATPAVFRGVAAALAAAPGTCSACSLALPSVPKLAIAKAGSDSVLAGGTAKYTVTLSNQGGSPTLGPVTFADVLPAALAFTSQTAGAPTFACAAAGAAVTCGGTPTAELAPGATFDVKYEATVSAAASGLLVNTASLLALGGDPRPPPASCGAAVPIAGQTTVSSDGLCSRSAASVATGTLLTSKTLAQVNGAAVPAGYVARPGDVLRYAIAVQATRGLATTTLTETLPASTTYYGTGTGGGEGWTLNGATGAYTQSVTVVTGTVTRNFTVRVAPGELPDGLASTTNTVKVTASSACVSCEVVTPTAPKLTISKAGPATLPEGGAVTYLVALTNVGGSPTTGAVAIQDTLPAGLAFGAQLTGAPALSCSAAPASATGQVVTCTGTPNLGAGASLSVSYGVQVRSGASGLLTNEALVTASGGDPRTLPATCGAPVPAAGQSSVSADRLCARASGVVAAGTISVSLALSTVGGAAVPAGYQARPGDLLGYTVTIAETSGRGGASTTVTATVPASTSYAGAAEGWSAGCGSAGTSCSRGVTLAASGAAAASFTVRVATPPAAGATDVTGGVSASAGTCGSCAVVTPLQPHFSIAKSGSASAPAAGQAHYTVALMRDWGSPPASVAFQDTLPDGLTFAGQPVVAGGAPLTCRADGQVVTCSGSPGLASANPLLVAYDTAVTATAAGTLVNRAQIVRDGGGTGTCGAADPAAGTGTVSADGQCARWGTAAVAGSLSVSLSLARVNLLAVPAGYQVAPGDLLEYAVEVTETTGRGGGAVQVTATVPEATHTTGLDQGWSTGCAGAGTSCTRSFTLAAAGQDGALFTVQAASALADGLRALTATVTAPGPAACPSCGVTTPTVPKLALSMTSPPVLPLGGTTSYTIAVANHGGSPTSGAVALSDLLPDGLTFSRQLAGAPALACSASGRAVRCAGTPAIPPGGAAEVSIGVTIGARAAGPLVSTATLTELGGDPRRPSCDAAVPTPGHASQSADGTCALASGEGLSGEAVQFRGSGVGCGCTQGRGGPAGLGLEGLGLATALLLGARRRRRPRQG